MARLRRFAVLGALVAIPVVASGFLLQSRSAPEGTLLLEQVLQLVSNRYVDTLTDNKLFEKAAHGLVRELNDPYSELLAPKEVKQFDTRTGGRYGRFPSRRTVNGRIRFLERPLLNRLWAPLKKPPVRPGKFPRPSGSAR